VAYVGRTERQAVSKYFPLGRWFNIPQHILGHIGAGFYESNDPINSVKALKEDRS